MSTAAATGTLRRYDAASCVVHQVHSVAAAAASGAGGASSSAGIGVRVGYGGRVDQVCRGSRGAAAGLRPGMCVTEVDGRRSTLVREWVRPTPVDAACAVTTVTPVPRTLVLVLSGGGDGGDGERKRTLYHEEGEQQMGMPVYRTRPAELSCFLRLLADDDDDDDAAAAAATAATATTPAWVLCRDASGAEGRSGAAAAVAVACGAGAGAAAPLPHYSAWKGAEVQLPKTFRRTRQPEQQRRPRGVQEGAAAAATVPGGATWPSTYADIMRHGVGGGGGGSDAGASNDDNGDRPQTAKATTMSPPPPARRRTAGGDSSNNNSNRRMTDNSYWSEQYAECFLGGAGGGGGGGSGDVPFDPLGLCITASAARHRGLSLFYEVVVELEAGGEESSHSNNDDTAAAAAAAAAASPQTSHRTAPHLTRLLAMLLGIHGGSGGGGGGSADASRRPRPAPPPPRKRLRSQQPAAWEGGGGAPLRLLCGSGDAWGGGPPRLLKSQEEVEVERMLGGRLLLPPAPPPPPPPPLPLPPSSASAAHRPRATRQEQSSWRHRASGSSGDTPLRLLQRSSSAGHCHHRHPSSSRQGQLLLGPPLPPRKPPPAAVKSAAAAAATRQRRGHQQQQRGRRRVGPLPPQEAARADLCWSPWGSLEVLRMVAGVRELVRGARVAANVGSGRVRRLLRGLRRGACSALLRRAYEPWAARAAGRLAARAQRTLVVERLRAAGGAARLHAAFRTLAAHAMGRVLLREGRVLLRIYMAKWGTWRGARLLRRAAEAAETQALLLMGRATCARGLQRFASWRLWLELRREGRERRAVGHAEAAAFSVAFGVPKRVEGVVGGGYCGAGGGGGSGGGGGGGGGGKEGVSEGLELLMEASLAFPQDATACLRDLGSLAHQLRRQGKMARRVASTLQLRVAQTRHVLRTYFIALQRHGELKQQGSMWRAPAWVSKGKKETPNGVKLAMIVGAARRSLLRRYLHCLLRYEQLCKELFPRAATGQRTYCACHGLPWVACPLRVAADASSCCLSTV